MAISTTLPVLSIVAALAATAIAEIPKDLDADERKMLALLGDAVSIAPSDASLDEAAIREAVLRKTTNDYLVTHGPGAGGHLAIAVTGAKRTPASWPKTDRDPMVMTVPGRAVLYLHQDADGRIVMPTQADLEQSVLVGFSPGELFLPATDDPRPYEMAVKVWDLHDPSDLEHTGSMKVVARDRGVWKVTTPAGTFDCRLYRLDYSGTVGPASVTDTTLLLASPKAGVVARIEGKRVSAFLVYNTDTNFAFVLDAPRRRDGEKTSPTGDS